MKTTNLVGKFATLATITVLGFVTSCNKDNEVVTAQDVTDASSESLTDSYYSDADDFANYAIDNSAAAGRVASDDRLSTCAVVTPGGNNTYSSGTITIDFGTGCSDSHGNTRKGIVNIAYSNGPVNSDNFTVTETFDNYFINDIQLQGTRTVKRLSYTQGQSVVDSITLVGGEAIWPNNGGTATRESKFERTVDLSTGTGTSGTITLTGEASGKGRAGKTYTMNIQTPIVHKTSCMATGIYMPVQGVKTFVIDGTKHITIDYGNGDCDRTITITINGHTKTVTTGLK
jgi:hypothetical protein